MANLNDTTGSGDQNAPGSPSGEGDQNSGEVQRSELLKAVGPQMGDVFSGLSDDNLKTAHENGFDKSEDVNSFMNSVLDSYRGLSGKLGENLQVPNGESSPEELDEFFSKIRPSEPSKYEFETPKDMHPDFPYVKEDEDWFKEAASEAGLHPEQAKLLRDKYVSKMNSEFTDAVGGSDSAITEAHESIQKEWGHEDSTEYKENLSAALRAIEGFGGEAVKDMMVRRGIMTSDGEVVEPAMAFILSRAGKAMFMEGGGGGPGEGGNIIPAHENPFHPEHINMTKQGQIINQDRNLAIRLIRQVGGNPGDYPGLT